MAEQNLAQFDAAFAGDAHLHLIVGSGWADGGVDPLGLRQVNLNLMDTALPGINNVTRRVRPYSVMAWAWWKASQVIEARQITHADVAELQDLVDRLEVLYVWSHFLADDDPGLPGRIVIRDKLPNRGSSRKHRFSGADWDAFRISRRPSTSLMAPIQYGPSVKALRWLIPAGGSRAFAASTEVMPAIQEFDRLVSTRLPRGILGSDPISMTPAQAESLHAAWAIEDVSPAECRVFRHLFYEVGGEATENSATWRRRRMLDLILHVLKQSKSDLSAAAIRQRLTSSRTFTGERLSFPDALVDVHRHWASLQARQMQRLALEALLSWIEVKIHEGISRSGDLVTAVHESALDEEDGADASTVGIYLDRASLRAGAYGWPGACGISGDMNIFALMDDLIAAQHESGCVRVPSLVLRALAYADAMTRALLEMGVAAGISGPLGGQNDRLPLFLASERLRSSRDRTLKSMWTEIIEAWVLGQHVRWSIARNGDGTQRLRVAMGDNGWMRLWKGAPGGGFAPTLDRLASAMSLAGDCRLVARRWGPNGEALYAIAD